MAITGIPLEEDIDEDMCKDAIHVLKVATAVGIDIWPHADLRKLSKKALRALAAILKDIEHKATWPTYLLCNMIVSWASH
eukprot:2956528-Karenia_brevis.AAC.1